MQLNAPVTLVSNTSRQAASLSRQSAPSLAMPALLIRKCTPPRRWRVSATKRSTASRSRTSQRLAWTPTPIAMSAVSVSSACSLTSRPGMLTKQKATLQPSLPNSIAIVRPSPVAPPVTITTFPCHPLVMGWARGSSSTVPLASGDSYSHDGRWPNPKDDKGIDWLRYEAAGGRGRGKDDRRKAVLTLSPCRFPFYFLHAPQTCVARPRPGRRRRLGCSGPPPGRDDQRRLARARRGRDLSRRVSFLQPLPRRPGLRPQRPPGHPGGAAGQRPGLRAHHPLGALRASLRRDRRRRSAGGTGPRRAVRLPPRHHLDRLRRGARGRGAGLHHLVRLHAPGWKVAGADGQGVNRRGHRRARHAGGAGHHGDPAGGAGPGRGERAQGQSLGRLHHPLYHPYRRADGVLDEGLATGAHARGLRRRRGPPHGLTGGRTLRG